MISILGAVFTYCIVKTITKTSDFFFRSEETAELLLEKSQIAENESALLTRKTSEAEQECHRIRMLSARTQEEKMMLEQKVR